MVPVILLAKISEAERNLQLYTSDNFFRKVSFDGQPFGIQETDVYPGVQWQDIEGCYDSLSETKRDNIGEKLSKHSLFDHIMT